MRTSRLIAAVGATALVGTSAYATPYSPVIGDFSVTAGTPFEVDITGGDEVYDTVDISIDWTDGGGNPWSNEAQFALYSDTGGFGTIYLNQDPPSGAAGNGDPATLTYSGALDTNYTGGDPLFFGASQSYGGSTGNWSNISITFTASGLDPFALADTETNALPAGGWTCYDLIISADGTEVIIDTEGTTSFGNNDTELFLLDTDGLTLLTTDDDGGTGLLSSISTTLDTGTYTVVVGGFDLTYDGANFAATDPDSGDVVVNVTTRNGVNAALEFKETVPEPGSLALLALGGLMIARRRRSA